MRIVFVVLIAVLLSACAATNQVCVPENVERLDILWDMHKRLIKK